MSIDGTIRKSAQACAKRFIEEEREFHLGFLPTEQSHPLTRDLSKQARRDPGAAVRSILAVDAELPSVARRIFGSEAFESLISAIASVISGTGRICFSGCGSTGRLAVMLEAMWREALDNDPAAGRALSIMTGGDRALIRSVEHFEDYERFGARQVADLAIRSDDLFIAISEGGETPSVIGTAEEAARRGATVFFVYNNPTSLLRSRIERSRRIIEHEGVVTLDLYSGSMALSGSTRMQATTLEMFVIGTAIEEAIKSTADSEAEPNWLAWRQQRADHFAVLIRELASARNSSEIARLAVLEAECYAQGGTVTYFAADYLLDIFSDTTERSPTFMLPPFRPRYDRTSPTAWSYAKDALRPAEEAWNVMLRRAPRGISWTEADYRAMNAPASLCDNPPALDRDEIYAYEIGTEEDTGRTESPVPMAVWCGVHERGTQLRDRSRISGAYLNRFGSHFYLNLHGPTSSTRSPDYTTEAVHPLGRQDIDLELSFPESPLRLFSHLAIKLVFNTFSTTSMALIGRIEDNWMIQVNPTNKKLIDRATRIISHLSGRGYEESCVELHVATAEQERLGGTESPVVRVLERLGIPTGAARAPRHGHPGEAKSAVNVPTSVGAEDVAALQNIVGVDRVLEDGQGGFDRYAHDQVADERYAHPADVVVLADNSEEVAAILRYAHDRGIAVTPRGAGTGLSGGAVPVRGGIVLSLERMTRIVEIDTANLTATVEPGVVTKRLDRELEPHGLFFAGYPMSEEICTIGGNVAENAGGGRAVKYGVTGNYVLGIEAVAADGRRFELGGKRLKDVTGYDLLKLLIGSEGTLAVITRVHLRLLPRPKAAETMLAVLPSTAAAIAAIPDAIRKSGVTPTSVEFMDATCTREACRLTGDTIDVGENGALLLYEVDGARRDTVTAQIESLAAVLSELGATVYREEAEGDNERFWNIRKKVPWALKRMGGGDQTLEDLTLPIASLSPMMDRLAEIADRYGILIPSFGHAADGNLHCNPIRPESMSRARWRECLPEVLREIYREAKTLGGTISGEHGIGHKRSRYIPDVLDPVALDLMRSVKATLDPRGILNPGKIFPE